jgi:hypothetical protein
MAVQSFRIHLILQYLFSSSRWQCCWCTQVRLNVLPALLEEAYAHMHGCLTASILGRKLFLQPFNRDVQVTPKVVAAMRSSLAYCKQVGGMLVKGTNVPWPLGVGAC